MRAALVLLLAMLVGSGCADAALHAAHATPKQWAPLAVSAPQRAWRNPDGSLGVCVDMWIAGGAWHSDPGATGAFSVDVPNPAGAVEIPFDAWKSHVSGGYEGGRVSGSCVYAVPRGACLLQVELVARADRPALVIDGQVLRVSDSAGVVVATLELRGDDSTAHPLLWPLVPLGYAGDVTLMLAAIPLALAVVTVALPFIAVASFMDVDPPVPSSPDSWARPECAAAP